MPEYFEDEFVIKSRDGKRRVTFDISKLTQLYANYVLIPNTQHKKIATIPDIIEQKDVKTIDYDTTGGEAGGVLGRLKWNSADMTLDLGVSDGSVTLQLGQELHTPCRNFTGTTIEDFRVVRTTGQQGNRVTVALAQANSLANCETTYGITTQQLVNNQTGMVTSFGLINDVNTEAFLEGTVLYLSATEAGMLTTTAPEAPNFRVVMGICVKQANPSETNGKVLVNIHKPISMNTLTGDTKIINPSNGQVIKYDGTKWVNGTLSETLTLNNLSDVSIIAPTEGDTLVYTGGNWENAEGAMFKSTYDTNDDGRVNTAELLQTSGDPDAWSSFSINSNFAQRPTFDGNNTFTGTNTFNALQINSGGTLDLGSALSVIAGEGINILPNELAQLDGISVVSTIQNQLNTKAPSITPSFSGTSTFTGTVVLPSATSIGSVSASEIAFLDGLTGSNLQTQLSSINSSLSDKVSKTTGNTITASHTFNTGTTTFNASTIFNLLSFITATPATTPYNIPLTGNVFNLSGTGLQTANLPSPSSVGRLLIIYMAIANGTKTISGHINGVTPTNKLLSTAYDFIILISTGSTWLKLLHKQAGELQDVPIGAGAP